MSKYVATNRPSVYLVRSFSKTIAAPIVLTFSIGMLLPFFLFKQYIKVTYLSSTRCYRESFPFIFINFQAAVYNQRYESLTAIRRWWCDE